MNGIYVIIYVFYEVSIVIEYVCSSCNNLVSETSTCPNCKQTLKKSVSKIFWCDKCNVPIFNEYCDCCGSKGHYISSDLTYVYIEEKRLAEQILGKEAYSLQFSFVWKINAGKYVIDGKVMNKSITTLNREQKERIKENTLKYNSLPILEDEKKFEEEMIKKLRQEGRKYEK